MAIIFSFILSLIFFALAVIHFNWAIGAKWGFDKTLPTNESGKKNIEPKKNR